MKRIEKQELIEKIFREVKDPELREQLFRLILDKEEPQTPYDNMFDKMGLNPKGIRKNIKLSNAVTIFVGIILFIVGVQSFNYFSSVKEDFWTFVFMLWIIFVPIATLLNIKFMNNFLKKRDKQ